MLTYLRYVCVQGENRMLSEMGQMNIICKCVCGYKCVRMEVL